MSEIIATTILVWVISAGMYVGRQLRRIPKRIKSYDVPDYRFYAYLCGIPLGPIALTFQTFKLLGEPTDEEN